jgi:surface protein
MKAKIIPQDKEHLIMLIKHEVQLQGVRHCDLNHIDVSQLTDMSHVFYRAYFHADISQWDTSNVTTMRNLFEESSLIGDISKWDTSNVKDMAYMFYKSYFNGDISQWNVSNVINMYYMFTSSQFNGDISQWDVRKVQSIVSMFDGSKFNKDISDWEPYSLSFGNYFEDDKMPIPYWGKFDSGDWEKRNIAITRYNAHKKLTNDLQKKLSQDTCNIKKRKI